MRTLRLVQSTPPLKIFLTKKYKMVIIVNERKNFMINELVKKESLSRMSKIEGQIRGVSKMINEEKYCVDILNQISAVRNALDGVARKILKRHVESCVTDAILKRQAEAKIEELMNTIFKYGNHLK